MTLALPKISLVAMMGLTGLLAGPFTEAQAQTAKNFYNTPYKTRNSGSFHKGQGILTFGLGIPNRGVDGYWYSSSRSGFGPLYVKYEYGIKDEISIGGYLAGSTSSYKYGNYKDRATAISLGAMGYYHFNKLIPVRNLDVYAGAGLAIRSTSYNFDDHHNKNNDSHTSFGPVFKAGARYYFTHTFGVYLETGYDRMSDLNIGVALRF